MRPNTCIEKSLSRVFWSDIRVMGYARVRAFESQGRASIGLGRQKDCRDTSEQKVRDLMGVCRALRSSATPCRIDTLKCTVASRPSGGGDTQSTRGEGSPNGKTMTSERAVEGQESIGHIPRVTSGRVRTDSQLDQHSGVEALGSSSVAFTRPEVEPGIV